MVGGDYFYDFLAVGSESMLTRTHPQKSGHLGIWKWEITVACRKKLIVIRSISYVWAHTPS
jgi:hypothetical protein